MALSATTLLTQVETAIQALLTGGHTSYSIGGRTVTKLDLKSLFEERRILQQEAARESGGGMFRLAKMSRTSK